MLDDVHEFLFISSSGHLRCFARILVFPPNDTPRILAHSGLLPLQSLVFLSYFWCGRLVVFRVCVPALWFTGGRLLRFLIGAGVDLMR